MFFIVWSLILFEFRSYRALKLGFAYEVSLIPVKHFHKVETVVCCEKICMVLTQTSQRNTKVSVNDSLRMVAYMKRKLMFQKDQTHSRFSTTLGHFWNSSKIEKSCLHGYVLKKKSMSQLLKINNLDVKFLLPIFIALISFAFMSVFHLCVIVLTWCRAGLYVFVCVCACVCVRLCVCAGV